VLVVEVLVVDVLVLVDVDVLVLVVEVLVLVVEVLVDVDVLVLVVEVLVLVDVDVLVDVLVVDVLVVDVEVVDVLVVVVVVVVIRITLKTFELVHVPSEVIVIELVKSSTVTRTPLSNSVLVTVAGTDTPTSGVTEKLGPVSPPRPLYFNFINITVLI
jgi:hypothetical protein